MAVNAVSKFVNSGRFGFLSPCSLNSLQIRENSTGTPPPTKVRPYSFFCIMSIDRTSLDRTLYDATAVTKNRSRDEISRKSAMPANNSRPDMYYYNRTVRNDASLVPPIRQTASIFKQPVTVHKNQESIVNPDLKFGPQEKPKQLFWEKRLEGLRACDTDGYELRAMDLPMGLKAVGPHVSQETLLQSVATALHVSSYPVTGQTGSRSNLEKNSGVFLNPDQPLIQAVAICEEDIKKQEDKVNSVRKKLQEAIKYMS